MFTYNLALFAGLIHSVSASTNAANVCTTTGTTVDCTNGASADLWIAPPLSFDSSSTEIVLSNTAMPDFSSSYVDLTGLNALEKITIVMCSSVNEITIGTLPSDLSSLLYLNLRDNSIADIDKDSFVGVASLIELDLSGNQLTEVHADLFSALVNLVSLKMNNNKMTGLSSGMFRYQSALNDLDLSGNRIVSTNVDAGAFSFTDPTAATPENGLQSLTILKLNDNSFSVVSKDSFKGLAALKELHFQDNLLTDVDDNAFDTNGALDLIDLGDNNLASLKESIFSGMQNLPSSLHVNGDYWNCCEIDWMRSASYVQSETTAICARPESAKNYAINDADAVSAVATECTQDEPNTPAAPARTAETPTSLSIEWAAVAGNAYAVHHYTVEYKETGVDWSLKDIAECVNGEYPDATGNQANTNQECQILAVVNGATLAKPEFTVDGLVPYKAYDIRVVATSQYELDAAVTMESASGASVEVSTAEDVPGAVASFVPSPSGSYAITLVYTPPASPNGEITQYTLSITADGADASTAITHQQVCIGANAGACTADMSYTFSGLDANTKYDVTVTPETSVGEGAVSSKSATTDEAPPAQPDPPTVQTAVDSIGSTYVNIEWVEPDAAASNGDITDYKIYIDPEPADVGGIGIVSAGAGITRDITGLEPSTQYTITLTAWTGSGESPQSTGLVINTNQAAPDTQQPPSGNALNSESFLATWEPPAVSNGRIIGYTFKYMEEDGSNITTQYINTSAAEPFVQVLGLNAATTYDVQVRSYNSMAASNYSGVFKITTDEAAPTTVAVSAIASGRTTIEVTWVEPEIPNGMILMYQVYKVSESQYVKNYPAYENLEQVLLYNATADARSFSHNFATAHMTYRYSVAACNAAACSPLEKIAQATTFESIPVNQYAPTVKILGATQALLRWSKPQYPNGEIIKYEVHKEQYDDETPSFSGIPTDVTDGKLSVTLINLNPDTVFRFTVTSFTSQGPSQRSEETPGTTESQKPSSRIATLVAVLSIFVIVLSIGFMWEHRLRRQNIDVSPKMDTKPLMSPFGSLPMAEIPGTFSQERQLNNPFASFPDGGAGRERSGSVSSASSSGSSFDGEAEA